MSESPRRRAGRSGRGRTVLVTRRLLRRWPLPRPDEAADKYQRGRVFVVGGAPEMPGAAILAATAALRAGAGKLQVAACASIAQVIAAAVPEGRVFALAETKAGGIDPSAAPTVAQRANQAQATLIGPGLVDDAAVAELLKRLVPRLEGTTLVLDAAALAGLRQVPHLLQALSGGAVLTPHAGEMARMLGVEQSAVVATRWRPRGGRRASCERSSR